MNIIGILPHINSAIEKIPGYEKFQALSFNGILLYVNPAMEKIPEYGGLQALGFVASLLIETQQRFSKTTYNTLSYIAAMKSVQCAAYLTSNSVFSSWKFKILTIISVGILYQPFILKASAELSNFTVPIVSLEVDRPPAISLFASGMELLNIASKVINSLGVGVVAQKMFNGKTEGKVRVVVTMALLGLCTLNVAVQKEEKPKTSDVDSLSIE